MHDAHQTTIDADATFDVPLEMPGDGYLDDLEDEIEEAEDDVLD